MKPTFDPKTLITLRRDNYWTQEDLAAASGVRTRTIQRLERSGGGSPETWKALAAAFDVDVETFEFKSGSQRCDKSNLKFGYMGMGMAFTACVVGCFFAWLPIFTGLHRGEGLSEFWPFLIVAVGMTLYGAVLMTWSWRHINPMASPI